MAVELVAFDLDGTIFDGGVIAPECVEAIVRLAEAGVRCVVNSGRSTDFQVELLAEYDLLPHFTALIGDERWIHLVDAGADDVELRSLEPWNTDVRNSWTELDPVAEDWARRVQQEAEQRAWPGRLSSRADSRRRGLWSVALDSADHARDLAIWLEPQLAGGPVAGNANGTIVHLYDAARDKGTSLLALAERLGLRAGEVLAFGDGFNDRPMLDGRHGFAAATIANADESVKRWVRDAGGPVAERISGLGVADVLATVFPSLRSTTSS
ncbi:HAD family hydrolase [Microlunatus speluncae]|uniref:HAD family hydrolase n=1 Tax=Microlunatus speluncae TaxID=2594267 RepID=UPI001375E740|nr:HAD family hydrolase [Microlunatus speluncae]